MDVDSLDRDSVWDWNPADLKVGDIISGGDIIGFCYENALFKQHKILVPPKGKGRIKEVMEAGGYSVIDPLIVVEYEDKEVEFSMWHKWSVRQPRPVAGRISGEVPLLTGQRVLDFLFPSILGGTCCIPGAFGWGKTCISQALSKYSNTDCIVYVGCGERGNEMAEVRTDFPELFTVVDGEKQSIMQRTCLIANTSNMPVAAREASLFTGITIAEYFRDMGMDVALMADSTSRWAEALREISGRLAEMPADSGFPANLGSKLAQFYERAGNVICMGSPDRQGSISVVGAVSPPGGDFSDPVTSSTLNIVQVFWGLDKKLAQRKHFPSVNWNISFSNYERLVGQIYTKTEPDFTKYTSTISQLLQQNDELVQIVQLVGVDSLSELQKAVLEIAKIIIEDFLQQNSYSEYDYYCPFHKTWGMAKAIICFYENSKKAINEAKMEENKISWAIISRQLENEFSELSQMKFKDPETPKDELIKYFDDLCDSIDQGFRKLLLG